MPSRQTPFSDAPRRPGELRDRHAHRLNRIPSGGVPLDEMRTARRRASPLDPAAPCECATCSGAHPF